MNLELLDFIRRSFLGQIYPAIRAIALEHDSCSKTLVLRYYLYREPNEDDFESLKIVAANIASMCPKDIVSDYKLECFKDTGPFIDVDALDDFFYCREE